MNRPQAVLLSLTTLLASPNMAKAEDAISTFIQPSTTCIDSDSVTGVDENSELVAFYLKAALDQGILHQRLFNNGNENVDLGLGKMNLDGLKPPDYQNFTCVAVGVKVTKKTEIKDGLIEAELKMCLPDMQGSWEADEECEKLTLRYGNIKNGEHSQRYKPTREEVASVLEAARKSLDDFRVSHGVSSLPASATARVRFSRPFDEAQVSVPFGGVSGVYICNQSQGEAKDWQTIGEVTIPVGLYHYPVYTCSPQNRYGRVGSSHTDFTVKVPISGPMTEEQSQDAAKDAVQEALAKKMLEYDWFDKDGNAVPSLAESEENEETPGAVKVNNTYVFPYWMEENVEAFIQEVSAGITAGLNEKGYEMKPSSSISEDEFAAFTDLSGLDIFHGKISGTVKFFNEKADITEKEVKSITTEQLIDLIATERVNILRNALFETKWFARAPSVYFDVKNCDVVVEGERVKYVMDPKKISCVDKEPGVKVDGALVNHSLVIIPKLKKRSSKSTQ